MLYRLREEGGVLSDTFKGQSKSGAPSSPRSLRLGWEKRNALHPGFPELLADAELPNDRLIALGIVSFEVVQ